jgi:hypothetical protein
LLNRPKFGMLWYRRGSQSWRSESRRNGFALPSARSKRSPFFLRKMSSIFSLFLVQLPTTLTRSERSEDEETAGCNTSPVADLHADDGGRDDHPIVARLIECQGCRERAEGKKVKVADLKRHTMPRCRVPLLCCSYQHIS